MRRELRPFTPSREDPAALDARTVGRDELLTVLDERLRAAGTSATRAHTLLVGPRGSGKTHVLAVARHRAEQQPELSGRLRFATVAEDAVALTRYLDLLRETARALGLAVSPRDRETQLESAIETALGGHVLVLIVENLDRVFETMGASGQGDLRSWVEQSGKVLLLAATPSLAPGMTDRSKPWFGGLIMTGIEGLEAEDGRRLLAAIAAERGDNELVDFLASDVGRGRVEAIAKLTGGSPRIWMLLAECVDTEMLDELVPAVEALLESLVPYYQQLLWDLPPNHRLIVQALAEGQYAALTANELAEQTGLSAQTVSKALSLLREGRWVRAEKTETDRRHTYYSLREPMLRHHFRYRATGRGNLALVVELLRAFFSPVEQRRLLATAEPESIAERYLVDAYDHRLWSSGSGYNDQDPDALLAEARAALAGRSVFSPETGRVLEACVHTSRGRPMSELLGRSNPPLNSAAAAALTASGRMPIAALLHDVATSTAGSLRAELTLVAACWSGAANPGHTLAQLKSIPTSASTERFDLLWRHEVIFWSSDSHHTATAIGELKSLVADQERILGPEHPDTLTTRQTLAYQHGLAGDTTTAITQYDAVLADHERILGPEHPRTLTTRHNLAYQHGQAGHTTTAIGQYEALLPVRERILGPEHPRTLTTRYNLAYCRLKAGDPVGAAHDFLYLTQRGRSEAPAGLVKALAVATSNPFGTKGDDLGFVLWEAIHGSRSSLVRVPAELRDLVAFWAGPPT